MKKLFIMTSLLLSIAPSFAALPSQCSGNGYTVKIEGKTGTVSQNGQEIDSLTKDAPSGDPEDKDAWPSFSGKISAVTDERDVAAGGQDQQSILLVIGVDGTTKGFQLTDCK